jgi:hypothetical protein
MRSLRDMLKKALEMGSSLHKGFFLDPDYVRSLNLGAIRNFFVGPGLP